MINKHEKIINIFKHQWNTDQNYIEIPNKSNDHQENNEILSFTSKWIELENILSEVS
jgi:hypothetical protein